jgi:hypothetical protein
MTVSKFIGVLTLFVPVAGYCPIGDNIETAVFKEAGDFLVKPIDENIGKIVMVGSGGTLLGSYVVNAQSDLKSRVSAVLVVAVMILVTWQVLKMMVK